jgi:hypothetical protein
MELFTFPGLQILSLIIFDVDLDHHVRNVHPLYAQFELNDVDNALVDHQGDYNGVIFEERYEF